MSQEPEKRQIFLFPQEQAMFEKAFEIVEPFSKEPKVKDLLVDVYLEGKNFQNMLHEGLKGLPQEVYKYSNQSGQMEDEAKDDWHMEKFTFTKEEGVLTHIKGAQYPVKTFIYKNPDGQNTMFTVNMIKSLLIESVKAISKPYFIPLLPFALKNKQAIMDNFNRIAFRTLSPHILKDEYWTKFGRALHFLIFTFCNEIGFTEKSSDTFSEIFSCCIDSDSAYRYRGQDIFSATSKEKLIENPRKELKRLMKLFREREGVYFNADGTQYDNGVANKFSRLLDIILLILYIPKYKKAFIKAIETVDFESLCYDESDRYWVIMRRDYNFLGMNQEQRENYAKEKGYIYPKAIEK